jgi:FAD:protein FMN transferase
MGSAALPTGRVAGADTIDAASRLVHRAQAMGGRLEIHVSAPAADAPVAEHDMRQVAARVQAWAAMLTRHDPASRLMLVNADPRPLVPVGPTLAAALRWALDAGEITGGAVDVSLLEARLRAEGAGGGPEAVTPRGPAHHAGNAAARPWRVRGGGRHRSGAVDREPGVRLDLDGVGKGWLADRALARLRWPGALIDADGDIAVRVSAGESWEIGIGDPRDEASLLAVLVLPGGLFGGRTYGVATSGTSIHHWGTAADGRHHLIDPATGAPSRSDVVQATVVATSAREAEAYAKAIVILGAATGLDLVERSDAQGAIALLGDGRTVALPRTSRLLA